MKILFITSNKVFPVKDGVDLPLSKIMEGLSSHHEISLLRTYSSTEKLNEFQNSSDTPSFIKKLFYLKVVLRGGGIKLIQEILGVKPFYFVDRIDNEHDLEMFKGYHFDWIWISPEGLLDVAQILKEKLFPNVRFALGINEPQYTVFYNQVNNILKRRDKFSLKSLAHFVRLPLIYFHEKRYLKRASLIHVQTQLEHKRLQKMLGNKYQHTFVVAPNGIKEELLPFIYENEDPKIILLITALDGSVTQNVDHFIERVWLKFQKNNSGIYLHLVGRAPDEERKKELESYPGVKVMGFVPQYIDAFNHASVAILPLFQNHGLINRVVDCMCAGVPMIGFKDAMQTIDGMKNGLHSIVVNNYEEMSEAMNDLCNNASLRMSLSKESKKLAKTRPTWEKSVKLIEQKLLRENHGEANKL